MFHILLWDNHKSGSYFRQKRGMEYFAHFWCMYWNKNCMSMLNMYMTRWQNSLVYLINWNIKSHHHMNIRMYIIWVVDMDIQPRQARVSHTWVKKVHHSLLVNTTVTGFRYGGRRVGARGDCCHCVRVPGFNPAASQTTFRAQLKLSWRQSTVVHGVPVLQLQGKYDQKIYIFPKCSYHAI